MGRSIEPPALPNISVHNSKTGLYSGTTSHRFTDPDVIQVPTPVTHSPSTLMKHKQAILHDVIGIDSADDSADLVLLGESLGKSNKGKTIEAVHDGYVDHQAMDWYEDIFYQPVMENSGPGNGVESSNGYTSVAHNVSDVDGHGSDQSCDDEDYTDLVADDYMDMDNYALLQAHFDNVNIPPGIEVPIPWLAEYDLGPKNTGSSSLHPWFHIESDFKNSHVNDLSQPSWSLEPTYSEIQGPSTGSSSLQVKMNAIDQSSPQLVSQTTLSKKKSDASQSRRHKLMMSLGGQSSKSHWSSGPSKSEKEHNVLGASTNHGFMDNSLAMKLPHGGQPPYWGQFESLKKGSGNSSSYHSNFVGPVAGSYPPGAQFTYPWWLKSSLHFEPITNYTANPDFFYPFVPFHGPPDQVFGNTWDHNSVRDGNNGTTTDSPVVRISDEARDEILRKFRNFKQFDTVEDTSDHYFLHIGSSMQHPKNWAKRIQEEWKLLEKDLPDSIFVRVYESRIDLLRAVIIGAEGTPYHDGLFFFDVFFPSGYPNVPPHVHYHSCGLRLNPNLYNCGKVCLSLLNTWSGNKNEMWLPGVSTILQVLVSIQGLILNTKPYFNEPGFAHLSGSASGEMRSLQYNEEVFVLSLRTMVYIIRKSPKNFEDFVVGHFCSRARDILVACKAYMDGAQVGCLVKGGVQDVDQGDRSCSKQFKNSLAAYVDMLVREFTQVGAKDCDKFLSPSSGENNQKPLGELPAAATFS